MSEWTLDQVREAPMCPLTLTPCPASQGRLENLDKAHRVGYRLQP